MKEGLKKILKDATLAGGATLISSMGVNAQEHKTPEQVFSGDVNTVEAKVNQSNPSDKPENADFTKEFNSIISNKKEIHEYHSENYVIFDEYDWNNRDNFPLENVIKTGHGLSRKEFKLFLKNNKINDRYTTLFLRKNNRVTIFLERPRSQNYSYPPFNISLKNALKDYYNKVEIVIYSSKPENIKAEEIDKLEIERKHKIQKFISEKEMFLYDIRNSTPEEFEEIFIKIRSNYRKNLIKPFIADKDFDYYCKLDVFKDMPEEDFNNLFFKSKSIFELGEKRRKEIGSTYKITNIDLGNLSEEQYKIELNQTRFNHLLKISDRIEKIRPYVSRADFDYYENMSDVEFNKILSEAKLEWTEKQRISKIKPYLKDLSSYDFKNMSDDDFNDLFLKAERHFKDDSRREAILRQKHNEENKKREVIKNDEENYHIKPKKKNNMLPLKFRLWW